MSVCVFEMGFYGLCVYGVVLWVCVCVWGNFYGCLYYFSMGLVSFMGVGKEECAFLHGYLLFSMI